MERAKEGEPIRVWSAGCSTGEEAYSIAILFKEVMEEMRVERDVKIFATDVDSRAIEQASRASIPKTSSTTSPPTAWPASSSSRTINTSSPKKSAA